MEPFTTRNENTFPACPSFAANISYRPSAPIGKGTRKRSRYAFIFVRESRGVHLVFADLTICEKYRWMPR
jgi:hypothetical protein